MKFFFILMLSAVSIADIVSIRDLKDNFKNYEKTVSDAWKRADEIKWIPVASNNEIDLQKCKEYQAKIEKQYSHSPFTMKFKRGFSEFGLCNSVSGIMNPEKLYFQAVNMKNQFGLPVSYVLQNRNRHSFTLTGTTTLYLDANFNIVETAGTASHDRDAEKDVFSATIVSFDKLGNRYHREYNTLNPNEPSARVTYFPNNDDLGYAMRIIRPRRSDQGKETVEVRIMQWATKKDWDKSFISPTFFFANFYEYKNEIWDTPQNYNWMATYWVGAKNVCSEGSVWQDRNLKAHMHPPAEEAEMGNCGNSW